MTINYIKALKQKQTETKFSTEALVKAIGVSPISLRGILKGKSKPNATTAQKYADYLGVVTEAAPELAGEEAHQADRRSQEVREEVRPQDQGSDQSHTAASTQGSRCRTGGGCTRRCRGLRRWPGPGRPPGGEDGAGIDRPPTGGHLITAQVIAPGSHLREVVGRTPMRFISCLVASLALTVAWSTFLGAAEAPFLTANSVDVIALLPSPVALSSGEATSELEVVLLA